MARLVAGGLLPGAAFDMTPEQLVYVYEERQREKAAERLAFIGDLQAAVASLMTKDGADIAKDHRRALERFADGG